MSSPRSPRRLLRLAINLLAPGCVFLPNYVAFVQYQGYPLWRWEVLLTAAVLLCAGLPFGLLLALRPRTFGAAGVVLVLLAWALQISIEANIDIMTLWGDLNRHVVAWAGPDGGLVASCLAILLIFVAVFMPLSWLGPNLGLVLATVFGVAVASSLLLPAEPPPLGETYRRADAAAKDLPPIIHLVLDEQIGIEGLPADISGGAELRDALRKFYVDLGFTLYGRAYSEYSRTRHSTIALLNGVDRLDGMIPDDSNELARHLWDSRWFRTLAAQGYLIHVYHMSGWDYCGGAAGHAARCTAYTMGSITNIENADLTVEAKAKVILASYLRTLVLYRVIGVLEGSPGQRIRILPYQPVLYGPDSLDTLQRILDDIRAEPRGTAYFAHLLIPHFTHLLGDDCWVKADPLTWTNYGDLDIATGALNSPASREARYVNYFAQVRCLHSALGRFFDGLKEIGAFEDATIILHGDHGSRIARVAPLTTAPQPLTDQDLRDMYSTLFAVHAPSQPAGYRRDIKSLQATFREMFLGGPPADGPPEVYLDYPPTALAAPTKPPFPRRAMTGFRPEPST